MRYRRDRRPLLRDGGQPRKADVVEGTHGPRRHHALGGRPKDPDELTRRLDPDAGDDRSRESVGRVFEFVARHAASCGH